MPFLQTPLVGSALVTDGGRDERGRAERGNSNCSGAAAGKIPAWREAVVGIRQVR